MNMWFLYALLFAAITAITIFLAKKIMQETGEYLYLFISNLFALPFLFILILTFYQIPKVDNTFWINTLIAMLLGVIGGILAYKAIRIEDISLVSPIAAFNPVFTALIALIFLNETIIPRGWLGIALICAGAYLLEISKSKEGIFKPLSALFTNRGVQLSFIAYFLWAITPIFQKTAIFHTYPQVPPYTSFIGMIGSVVLLSAICKNSLSKAVKFTKKYLALFLLLGILGGIGQAAAMLAFASANLGFATAVFKLSIIFIVIVGWIFLKEKNIKDRLIGSSVMLGGVLLLVT